MAALLGNNWGTSWRKIFESKRNSGRGERDQSLSAPALTEAIFF